MKLVNSHFMELASNQNLHSYFLIKKQAHTRIPFSSIEDKKLRFLVCEYGEENWKIISKNMKNRNTRQCRERWNNYLSPKINNFPWSEEEDKLLEKLYHMYGPKWSSIAKNFDGRTYITIKNRFLLLQRRKTKEKDQDSNNITPPKNTTEKTESKKTEKEDCQTEKWSFFNDEFFDISFD